MIDCGHSHSNYHFNSIWQFDEGKTQLCLNALNIHWIYHLTTRLKYQSSSYNNIYSSMCWNQFDQFCSTNQGFVKLSVVVFFCHFWHLLVVTLSVYLRKKVNECSTSSFQNMNKIFKLAFFFLHVQHLRCCLKGTRQLVNYSLCGCG